MRTSVIGGRTLRSEEMVTKAANAKLASCERRYRELAEQLGAIGYMPPSASSSGRTGAARRAAGTNADPPRLHRPYWLCEAKLRLPAKRSTSG